MNVGLLTNCSGYCELFVGTYLTALSAYIWHAASLQLSGVSLIYRQKNSGPNIEPCGIPILQFLCYT